VAYLLIAFQGEVVRSRTFSVVAALGILVIFSGLRGTMTPDMERYAFIYNQPLSPSSGVEPSFFLLARLLRAMGFDYHALFFAYTLITLLFTYLGIRNYTSHVTLSLLLYVLLPGYFLNLFVEMRELSAVAIAFYAMSVLKRKHIKMRMPLFLALMILAFCFHYSAVFCLATVLIAYKFIAKPHSKKVYLLLLFGTLLIPTSFLMGAINLFATPLLPARYQGYITMFMQVESSLAESGQLLKTLIYVAIATLFVYWRSPALNKNDDPSPLNLFVIGVVILNITRSFAAASRLSYYFLIYQIILFPEILAGVKDRVGRLLAAYTVVLFYLAQFMWGLFYYSVETGGYPYLHYQNVLFSLFK
jgi:hypothetical protein